MNQPGHFAAREWRVLSFNVENLFLYLDRGFDIGFDCGINHKETIDPRALSPLQWRKMSSALVENKPLDQVIEIARAIEDINPDFALLCEVGGRESLANFSHYFLNDRYVPYLTEGNSDRGIDIGFLVKRGLPFTYDLVSHRERPLDFQYPHEKLSTESGYRAARSHRFSRDIVELRVFDGEKPVLNLINVHLKSPLDRGRIDPGGRDRRQAECEVLTQIYREARTDLEDLAGASVPVIVAGDFNGVASGENRDLEFKALDATDLRCALDVAGVAPDERYTWCFFQGNRPGFFRQIDYVFVSPELVDRVDPHMTWVYRYKDEQGRNRLAPRNATEKRRLPSDHFPVVLTLTQVPQPVKPTCS